MNHIIDNIYLGSYKDSKDYCQIFKYNIKYIFNVAKECEIINHPDVFSHKFSIIDLSDYNQKLIDIIYNMIESVEKNDNILINCKHGRTRSAFIVLIYLLKKYECTLKDAFTFLKEKRSVVNKYLLRIGLLKSNEKLQTIKKIVSDLDKNESNVDIDNK